MNRYRYLNSESVIRLPERFLATLLLPILLFFSGPATAQEEPLHTVTNRAIGISGKMDRDSRSPDMGVTVNRFAERVQIVADAHVPNTDIDGFPLQFEFYVNRRLFSTQIRSDELPGPVGIDVTSNIARPPFNYAVVAKVLMPSGRPFTSMITGAVFNDLLTATLDCTLSQDGTTYVANSVSTDQIANGTFRLSFTTEGVNSGSKINLSGSFTVNGSEVSSSVTTVRDESLATSLTQTLTGTADFTDSRNLEGFSVSSEGGENTLSCS